MKHRQQHSPTSTITCRVFAPSEFCSVRHATTGVALLLFAITWVAVPVQAGTISGTFDGTGTLMPTGTPGMFIENFTGDGTDTTYGAFDAMSQSRVDFSNPPNIVITNAMLTQIFLQGELFGKGSGSGTGNGHGTATFTANFVITGGTGIFEHDHGEITLTGTITQTSPTTIAVSDASYTGTLVTPEPASLVLLLLGATLGRRALTKKQAA